MKVQIRHGHHGPEVAEIFGVNVALFQRADLLTVLYRDRWCSALVSDGRRAMLHVFVPTPIGDTGRFDAEPWLGYAGPTLTCPDPTFAAEALAAYREACRDLGVIAELIRFDPLLRNDRPFANALGIEIFEGRPIAIAPVAADDAGQLALYPPACQRQIRRARGRFTFARLDTTAIRELAALYSISLQRVGAARRWHFDPEFFDRAERVPCISCWGVWDAEQLVSGALVVAAPAVAHSLLVANADMHQHPGASDFLMHEVIRAHAGGDYGAFCLGGGRSSSHDDGLLVFKRKFAADRSLPLVMGYLQHDPAAVAELEAYSASESGCVVNIQPSTEILQTRMTYRLRRALADPDCCSP
jgi:hypothetical protein